MAQNIFPLAGRKYDVQVSRAASENSSKNRLNLDYLWYNYFQYVGQNKSILVSSICPQIYCKPTDVKTISYYNFFKVHMCMISMKNILLFVKFWGFFPKWKEESISSITEITRLLPSMEETYQPCQTLITVVYPALGYF